MDVNLLYTMCLLKSEGRVLLLNREKAPNMGLWNGLGGKLNPGETALECARREFAEEAGLDFSNARFAGIATWESETGSSGMYLFVGEAPADLEYQTPRQTEEGILDWKEISWILHPNNFGVAPLLQQFLKSALEDAALYEYRSVFRNGALVDFRTILLENEILV